MVLATKDDTFRWPEHGIQKLLKHGVKLFGEETLQSLLQDLYVLVRFVTSPIQQGWPCQRERQIVILILKTFLHPCLAAHEHRHVKEVLGFDKLFTWMFERKSSQNLTEKALLFAFKNLQYDWYDCRDLTQSAVRSGPVPPPEPCDDTMWRCGNCLVMNEGYVFNCWRCGQPRPPPDPPPRPPIPPPPPGPPAHNHKAHFC